MSSNSKLFFLSAVFVLLGSPVWAKGGQDDKQPVKQAVGTAVQKKVQDVQIQRGVTGAKDQWQNARKGGQVADFQVNQGRKFLAVGEGAGQHTAVREKDKLQAAENEAIVLGRARMAVLKEFTDYRLQYSAAWGSLFLPYWNFANEATKLLEGHGVAGGWVVRAQAVSSAMYKLLTTNYYDLDAEAVYYIYDPVAVKEASEQIDAALAELKGCGSAGTAVQCRLLAPAKELKAALGGLKGADVKFDKITERVDLNKAALLFAFAGQFSEAPTISALKFSPFLKTYLHMLKQTIDLSLQFAPHRYFAFVEPLHAKLQKAVPSLRLNYAAGAHVNIYYETHGTELKEFSDELTRALSTLEAECKQAQHEQHSFCTSLYRALAVVKADFDEYSDAAKTRLTVPSDRLEDVKAYLKVQHRYIDRRLQLSSVTDFLEVTLTREGVAGRFKTVYAAEDSVLEKVYIYSRMYRDLRAFYKAAYEYLRNAQAVDDELLLWFNRFQVAWESLATKINWTKSKKVEMLLYPKDEVLQLLGLAQRFESTFKRRVEGAGVLVATVGALQLGLGALKTQGFTEPKLSQARVAPEPLEEELVLNKNKGSGEERSRRKKKQAEPVNELEEHFKKFLAEQEQPLTVIDVTRKGPQKVGIEVEVKNKHTDVQVDTKGKHTEVQPDSKGTLPDRLAVDMETFIKNYRAPLEVNPNGRVQAVGVFGGKAGDKRTVKGPEQMAEDYDFEPLDPTQFDLNMVRVRPKLQVEPEEKQVPTGQTGNLGGEQKGKAERKPRGFLENLTDVVEESGLPNTVDLIRQFAKAKVQGVQPDSKVNEQPGSKQGDVRLGAEEVAVQPVTTLTEQKDSQQPTSVATKAKKRLEFVRPAAVTRKKKEEQVEEDVLEEDLILDQPVQITNVRIKPTAKAGEKTGEPRKTPGEKGGVDFKFDDEDLDNFGEEPMVIKNVEVKLRPKKEELGKRPDVQGGLGQPETMEVVTLERPLVVKKPRRKIVPAQNTRRQKREGADEVEEEVESLDVLERPEEIRNIVPKVLKVNPREQNGSRKRIELEPLEDEEERQDTPTTIEVVNQRAKPRRQPELDTEEVEDLAPNVIDVLNMHVKPKRGKEQRPGDVLPGTQRDVNETPQGEKQPNKDTLPGGKKKPKKGTERLEDEEDEGAEVLPTQIEIVKPKTTPTGEPKLIPEGQKQSEVIPEGQKQPNKNTLPGDQKPPRKSGTVLLEDEDDLQEDEEVVPGQTQIVKPQTTSIDEPKLIPEGQKQPNKDTLPGGKKKPKTGTEQPEQKLLPGQTGTITPETKLPPNNGVRTEETKKPTNKRGDEEEPIELYPLFDPKFPHTEENKRPDEKIPGDNLPRDNVPGGKLPEGKLPGEKQPSDNLPRDNLTGGKLPEGTLPVKKHEEPQEEELYPLFDPKYPVTPVKKHEEPQEEELYPLFDPKYPVTPVKNPSEKQPVGEQQPNKENGPSGEKKRKTQTEEPTGERDVEETDDGRRDPNRGGDQPGKKQLKTGEEPDVVDVLGIVPRQSTGVLTETEKPRVKSTRLRRRLVMIEYLDCSDCLKDLFFKRIAELYKQRRAAE